MHKCPKTHFKHKCMHASHQATSSCHINMPCHHTTSSCHLACHVSMPHHHDTLSCHVIRMHFLTTTWQLKGVPRGTSAKIFPVGAKLQNAISFASGVRLTRRLHRWNRPDEIFDIYFCCNMMILKIRQKLLSGEE